MSVPGFNKIAYDMKSVENGETENTRQSRNMPKRGRQT